MNVLRLSALHNGSIYTPGDIPVTQFRYRLSGTQGHSVDGSDYVNENFQPISQCLNRLRHRVPFIINIVLPNFVQSGVTLSLVHKNIFRVLLSVW
jgi:hypothetical protein